MNPIIEEEDKEILAPFFENLVTKSDLGYVLLGEKPAILLGYVDHFSWKYPICSLGSLSPYFQEGNQRFKKAWKILQKYSSQISDDFLIAQEPSPFSPLAVKVFIIHRALFAKVVNENKDLFESLLGRKISAELLLEEAKQKGLYSGVLKKNNVLLGIILGYGRTNSILYSQKNWKELAVFPDSKDSITSVALPIFRADMDTEETAAIRNKYLKCRQKIIENFVEQDSFSRVIQILFKTS